MIRFAGYDKTDRKAGRPTKPIATACPLIREIFMELERLGLTHIEVAKRAKISHKSMSEWRLGKTIPNAFILQGLARAVGMELTLTKR